MDTLPNSLHARDKKYLLHPVTNARLHEQNGPMVITRGQGIHVYDDAGKEYIEGLAGLWSVAVGFGEKRLVDAATRQMNQLPYYHMFGSKSHEGAIELGEKLVQMTPERLTRAFFTNSGSEANDTVVKMVWYYNNVLGRPEKKKIIARRLGYHGITIASGSLTGLPVNHADFDLPLPQMKHVTTPHHYRFAEEGESEEQFSDRLAKELEDTILAEGPDTVAAFIGEPVIGAGGVLVPPAGYWEKIQAVCRKYDVLLIIDEVIMGFGRSGRMFACEYYGIDPDFLVLSKQITSSYQPLAAILLTDAVYQAIADGSARNGVFGHGFTGSGHPVAMAVALENLKIIEERGLVANAALQGELMRGLLAKFAGHPLVGEVRGIGLIAAVEMVADKASKAKFAKPGTAGAAFTRHAQAAGLINRCVGDSACFCPPLIITADEVEEMVRRAGVALDATAAELGV